MRHTAANDGDANLAAHFDGRFSQDVVVESNNGRTHTNAGAMSEE
jgi:hypothetical protein